MFCRICNPTAKNIRICDPKNTPINQKIGSKRIENPYTQFRQIFRCAQQHVQISRHISLVATYPSARDSFLLIKMQPTDLTVAGCGVCMMLPGTILPPGMGVLFFWGYTSVIFCCGRNFSRPTVHYSFFKVGRLLPSLSSYCQPLPLRAAFMASTAVCQSPSVTIVVPPVPTWSSPMPCIWPLLPQ